MLDRALCIHLKAQTINVKKMMLLSLTLLISDLVENVSSKTIISIHITVLHLYKNPNQTQRHTSDVK